MSEYEMEVEVIKDEKKETCSIIFDLEQYLYASEDPNSFGADPERRNYIKEVLGAQIEDGVELFTSLHEIKRELDEALEEYEYNIGSDFI